MIVFMMMVGAMVVMIFMKDHANTIMILFMIMMVVEMVVMIFMKTHVCRHCQDSDTVQQTDKAKS